MIKTYASKAFRKSFLNKPLFFRRFRACESHFTVFGLVFLWSKAKGVSGGVMFWRLLALCAPETGQAEQSAAEIALNYAARSPFETTHKTLTLIKP